MASISRGTCKNCATLAAANAIPGDTAKAKTTYEDFFGPWKDTDPDIPLLKEAKAELLAGLFEVGVETSGHRRPARRE